MKKITVSLGALALCATGAVAQDAAPEGGFKANDPCFSLQPIYQTHRLPPAFNKGLPRSDQKLVTMQVTIGADGTVLDDALAPDGSSGSPDLDGIGLSFVKETWRWRARGSNCGPVKTQVALIYGGASP